MAPRTSAAAQRRARLVPVALVERAEHDVPYGRVSSDQQREAESINAQKAVLLKDITARDDPDLPISQQRKLVGEFWDDGVSGTIPLEQRPEGRRLVGRICSHADINCPGNCARSTDLDQIIDAVWVTKLDRLARKLQILIEIEHFLRKHGVALRCLEFNIDTSNSMGKLIFTILGAIAEWEREVILERTINGRIQKASEGKFVGGRRPLGFNVDEDGHLAVDETLVGKTGEMAYRIVQKIFDNVALHGSTAGREAERFGLSERRVGILLHNPRYKGEGGMLADGEWVAATQHNPPQIVSPEIWDLAQVALIDNRKNSTRNRRYDYLLSQLMQCCEPHEHVPVYDENGVKMGRNPKTAGVCGRTFIGRTAKVDENRTRFYAYYYCTRRTGCTAKVLRARDVEDVVWAEVAKMLRNPAEYLDEALSRRNQVDLVRELRTELTVIVNQLSKYDSERLSVLRSKDKGHYTEAEADVRMAEIRAAVDELQQRQAALELQLRSVTVSLSGLRRAGVVPADIAEQLDHIEALCQSTDPTDVRKGRERKEAILHSFLDRIEVRTGANGTSRLRLVGRNNHDLTEVLGNQQKMSVEPRSPSETSDNRQHDNEVSFVTEITFSRSAA